MSYESKNCGEEINALCHLAWAYRLSLDGSPQKVILESYVKKERFESFITHQSLLFNIFMRLEASLRYLLFYLRWKTE